MEQSSRLFDLGGHQTHSAVHEKHSASDSASAIASPLTHPPPAPSPATCDSFPAASHPRSRQALAPPQPSTNNRLQARRDPLSPDRAPTRSRSPDRPRSLSSPLLRTAPFRRAEKVRRRSAAPRTGYVLEKMAPDGPRRGQLREAAVGHVCTKFPIFSIRFHSINFIAMEGWVG
jgi:hypothetical protein